MKTKLSAEQIKQLDNLIEQTILPALVEDGICEPDMSDAKNLDSDEYDNLYQDRLQVLYVEALTYLKNNLHWPVLQQSWI